MSALRVSTSDNIVVRVPIGFVQPGLNGTAFLPSSQPIIQGLTSITVSFFESIESSSTAKKIEAIWRKYYKNKANVKPIDYQTKRNAELFYKLIALHTSAEPDTSGFPNGEIGFDWESKKGTLSVLIDEKKIYFYAESANGKRRKGSEVWSNTVPIEILKYIEDFIENE